MEILFIIYPQSILGKLQDPLNHYSSAFTNNYPLEKKSTSGK